MQLRVFADDGGGFHLEISSPRLISHQTSVSHVIWPAKRIKAARSTKAVTKTNPPLQPLMIKRLQLIPPVSPQEQKAPGPAGRSKQWGRPPPFVRRDFGWS